MCVPVRYETCFLLANGESGEYEEWKSRRLTISGGYQEATNRIIPNVPNFRKPAFPRGNPLTHLMAPLSRGGAGEGGANNDQPLSQKHRRKWKRHYNGIAETKRERAYNAPAIHIFTNLRVSPPALGKVHECRRAGVWVSTCSLFALELLPGHRRQKGARSVAEGDRELAVPERSRKSL